MCLILLLHVYTVNSSPNQEHNINLQAIIYFFDRNYFISAKSAGIVDVELTAYQMYILETFIER